MRMQSKIITIAAALALTAAPALAQVSIGGRIGGAMTTQSTEVDVELQSRIGFSIGAFADISVSDIVSIQPELLYTQKGTELEFNDVTSGTKLSYLQVPVTAKLSMPMSGSSIQPYVFAGPSVAFKLACTEYSNAEGSEDEACAQEGEDDQFESTEFSLLGGVGAAFDLGSGSASIDVRYDLGLSNVVITQNEDDPNAKNRAFSVTLGYSIPLGM